MDVAVFKGKIHDTVVKEIKVVQAEEINVLRKKGVSYEIYVCKNTSLMGHETIDIVEKEEEEPYLYVYTYDRKGKKAKLVFKLKI